MMNDDIFGKIKDFLKALREDLLFEADKNLKQLAQDLQKLEKKIKEVNGENGDFVQFLNDKNTDPNDKERADLINKLLGESDGSKAQIGGITGEKDKLKELYDTINGKLKAMFANPSAMKMADLEGIIKQTEDASGVIGKKMKELDGIHDDIEDRKKRWNEFES